MASIAGPIRETIMADLRALLAKPGANDVEYTDPAFPDRPLILRSARPRHCDAATPVLFVHHGVLRNGYDYRDFWLPLVDEAGILVIAPEFTNEAFPGAPWYNFGNLHDAAGALNPRERWTYGIDARLFERLRADGVTTRARYGLFGHSAGGQFVHRSLSVGFRDHVAAAVTANAGTYSMPDLAIPFPYGLGATGLAEADLDALLRFRLTVMAGTADIETASEHFPKEPAAMAQGGTRHERAHRYVETARRRAEARGLHCAWTIIDVPDVAHDGERMSQAAAPILAAALHASP
jgi:hypothetical protein